MCKDSCAACRTIRYQRMNELAVQASNGTNSEDDHAAIQAEIEQLTTEIDHVAETTKFNETYLLKGTETTSVKAVTAHDAGLAGTLGKSENGKATFTADKLEVGSSVTIAGKEYTAAAGWFADDNTTTADDIADLVKEGNYVTDDANNKYYYAVPKSSDNENDISLQQAYDMMAEELAKASSIGADADMTNKITIGIESMGAASLGIKSITVADDSGVNATYAIDAITDALSKVSTQGVLSLLINLMG